uniref:Uncharacterized protein n=1 Tax=Gossypium raimondii TaxID=29730 RepID=A0A0D2TM25_GOSRA|nr:hypothetical protein B456_009G089400 [Gossypium raimondii]
MVIKQAPGLYIYHFGENFVLNTLLLLNSTKSNVYHLTKCRSSLVNISSKKSGKFLQQSPTNTPKRVS